MDITVAIPTYKGSHRLPALFTALQHQTGTQGIQWEILVVDNNSPDHTAAVIQHWQQQWANQGFTPPLRYCREDRQGAAFARQRAMGEAQGDWVAFVDDDNVPALDWLGAIAAFRHQSPRLGAFSGRIKGAYAAPPPEGFDQIKGFLAIRDHGSQPCRFRAENLQLPPAACVVVRRSAWLAAVPPTPRLSGKVPGRFIQGDDYEPLLHLHKAGWEIWYTPSLCTHHHITADRFDRAYLLTLAQGCGLATYQLRSIITPPAQQPIMVVRTILGNVRRLVIHGLTYRQRIGQELVPGFLWAFYWGSVCSPFVRRDRPKNAL
ncbi:hormogonium polysaccharide biosynthesis glycosyltransferase HpsE [Prochlorothrix hollandica]|uniref:Glycosyl transferase n=1 Tax=Prochlorothrix hollandica PCC 9006 = CALU 1027 TaxID=317619 RepID=A0A0M2PPT1_PROHO|nr:hormogonium polysaccharide biosynthesis glycosyltransferase HpsE [Prochlorothrix hollandica]KKI98575.1 glycosyl transferase [Prochlorothrix hollandica PCC 9006 = CALU 1027]